jgi:hypothetical protein
VTGWRWMWIVAAVCLVAAGCDKTAKRKPDATKGAVAGTVFCADTGKPARFATVTLTPVPRKDVKPDNPEPLHAEATVVTGLNGEFRIEAVAPGRYYAFATLDGYLDPQRGIDFQRLEALGSDQERAQDAIKQWKEELAEVTVQVGRASTVPLQLHRGAEIDGTVSFDDGSPAIGMHFQLSRKTAKNGWTGVGTSIFGGWALDTVSDSHGRFNIGNLPSGEYGVCALLPVDSEDSAPAICLGNTLRKKDAVTVKVNAGETAKGEEIVIPLTGLHTLAGRVEAASDGHAPTKATVHLLYADNREEARKTATIDDGSFSFPYVAEDKYILQVSDAVDMAENSSSADSGDASGKAATAEATLRYALKEILLTVQGDIEDINVNLVEVPKEQAPQ